MTDPLSSLPLFATDREIAVAIVGKERASMYVKTVIPQLERQGFPRVDPLHDGRPVLLVRRFYERYWGLTAGYQAAGPDGEERLGEWTDRARRGKRVAEEPDRYKEWQRKAEDREKHRPVHKLNAQQMRALRFLADHPDCLTSDLVPNAAEKTMEALAKVGCLRAGGKDYSGQREWHVTDEGRAELQREETYRDWKFD